MRRIGLDVVKLSKLVRRMEGSWSSGNLGF
jgi:hypothetical protein